MKIQLIGGDRRQLYLADYIRAHGFQVSTSARGTAAPPDWEADICILPLPATRDGVFLNAPMAAEPVALQSVLDHFKGKLLFGGMLPPAPQASYRVIDYFAAEEVTIGNIVPTVEGALALAIENTPFTLLNHPALVLGAGRIGSLLASRLTALGAAVTVAARREASLAACRALGAKARLYEDLPLQRFRLIFNTVPARVLEEERLRRLPQDALLIELASKPGGFDPQKAEALGLRVMQAPGLPGKFAPETAAEIIGEYILKEMEHCE